MNTVGQQKYRIGVDIGGTGIKIGVIDGDFKVVKKNGGTDACRTRLGSDSGRHNKRLQIADVGI